MPQPTNAIFVSKTSKCGIPPPCEAKIFSGFKVAKRCFCTRNFAHAAGRQLLI